MMDQNNKKATRVLVFFALALCKGGVRTNEDMVKIMEWGMGPDWKEIPMNEWPTRLAIRQNIYCDSTMEEFMDALLEGYREKHPGELEFFSPSGKE